jgi:hypothetical protein
MKSRPPLFGGAQQLFECHFWMVPDAGVEDGLCGSVGIRWGTGCSDAI